MKTGPLKHPRHSGVYIADVGFAPLAVKIGYTADRLDQRLRNVGGIIRRNFPEQYPEHYRPRLIVFLEGARELEKQLHIRFASHHCPNPVFNRELLYFGGVREFADRERRVLGFEGYDPETQDIEMGGYGNSLNAFSDSKAAVLRKLLQGSHPHSSSRRRLKEGLQEWLEDDQRRPLPFTPAQWRFLLRGWSDGF